MAATGLVKARWIAGFPCELPGGIVLHPGDTHRISAGEAQLSDNWAPVADKPKAADSGDKE